MDIVPPHYVYTLAYPDGKVFYVGKGIDNRIDDHERDARKGVKSHKCNVIRKIWASGEQIIKTILARFDTHKEALAYEVALIFFMDDLTNLTYGGEGIVGLPRTAEHQRKIADARRGQKTTEELRQKLSEAHKNSARNAELLREINERKRGKPSWNKGIPFSEDRRRMLSEQRKGRPRKPHTEETRRKISESNKGKSRPPVTDETRQKLSTAFKGREFTPEWRRKISEAKKGKKTGIKQSSETIAKRVATIKKRNAEKATACLDAQISPQAAIPIYQQQL